MSRAQIWRNCLLGSPYTIHFIREYTINIGKISKHNDDILKDIKRTYPMNAFFNDHIEKLSNILNTYAYVNNGMGYAQGMAFLAFVLFKVYHEDDPLYAAEDTFYSLHNIIQVIRPAYPLNDKDKSAVNFNDHMSSSVALLIGKKNKPLALKLKEMDLIKIFIYQHIPCLFANRYKVEDCCILWDFIIRPESKEMFHRILCIVAGMIMTVEPVVMNMSFDSILGIMQHNSTYNVRRVITKASLLLNIN